jgi:site-specific DNA recombinase
MVSKSFIHRIKSMRPYFVYCRKSSEAEDRQVLSIESQLNESKRLADFHSLTQLEFFTESQSAKEPGRPIFNEMMRRISRGEAEGILCWKPDRLARNPVDCGSVIWALKQPGITIITPTQTYSLDSILLLYLEFGMAHKYVDDLSRNVKRGLKTKAELGWHPGLAPLGYLNEPAGSTSFKQVVVDPDRFSLVRRMWDFMLTGTYSVAEIHRIANTEWGFRTRLTKREGGKPLARSALYRILSNPFYYGTFEYPRGSGIWYAGAHRPMVTREEYDRVQALLGRPDRPRPKTHSFPYRGLMSCSHCGASVTAEEKWKLQKNGNSHHYVYYHCSKRKDPTCPERSIEEVELTRQIHNYLSSIEIPQPLLSWIYGHLDQLRVQDDLQSTATRDSVERALHAAQKSLDELTAMRYRHLVDDEQYSRSAKALTVEVADLKSNLSTVSQSSTSTAEPAAQLFQFACYARFAFAEGDDDTRRKIVEVVGSNLLLKAKTLDITLRDPFRQIATRLHGLPADFYRFEPPKVRSNPAPNPPCGGGSCPLLGLVDDVRTYLSDPSKRFHIPILRRPPAEGEPNTLDNYEPDLKFGKAA